MIRRFLEWIHRVRYPRQHMTQRELIRHRRMFGEGRSLNGKGGA
jgi:hypothetical protein